MTTGALAGQQVPRQRYVRHRRVAPWGEVTKVLLALVLNAILFGMLVF